jgi:hypothetical protein
MQFWIVARHKAGCERAYNPGRALEGEFPMSVNPIPAGFHTVAPNIIVKNIDAAVSFYKRAFGAEEILRLFMPDGKVVHCELKFGDSRVNLGESMEGWPEHSLLRFLLQTRMQFSRRQWRQVPECCVP